MRLCHPRDSHLEPALSASPPSAAKHPAQAWRRLAQASVLTCSISRPASVRQSLSSRTTHLPYVWSSSSSATPSASTLFLQLPGLAPGPLCLVVWVVPLPPAPSPHPPSIRAPSWACAAREGARLTDSSAGPCPPLQATRVSLPPRAWAEGEGGPSRSSAFLKFACQPFPGYAGPPARLLLSRPQHGSWRILGSSLWSAHGSVGADCLPLTGSLLICIL